MKDQRARDIVNSKGREHESTSVGRDLFLSKRGLENPVYALFGRNCDRMELINVYFSRIV